MVVDPKVPNGVDVYFGRGLSIIRPLKRAGEKSINKKEDLFLFYRILYGAGEAGRGTKCTP